MNKKHDNSNVNVAMNFLRIDMHFNENHRKSITNDVSPSGNLNKNSNEFLRIKRKSPSMFHPCFLELIKKSLCLFSNFIENIFSTLNFLYDFSNSDKEECVDVADVFKFN